MFIKSCRSAFVLGLYAVALSGFSACPAMAQVTSAPENTSHETNAAEAEAKVAEVVEAAQEFINSLNEDQKKRLIYEYDDQKQRQNWSNLPEGMVRRGGLRWEELKDDQRKLLKAMLKATLSEAGYAQVIDNMHGDEILHREVVERGGRNQPDFGENAYYVSLLGQPSSKGPWMWQFGGHHLAINATIVGPAITLAPSLTGGQPMRYQWEGTEVVQMKDEIETAYRLADSLTETQRKAAVLSNEPANMIFGPGNDGAKPRQEGILASQLTAKQKELLLQLIELRIGILNSVHAERELDQVRTKLDETWFAWFGSTKVGEAATYRIQGPNVLIEFSPQALGGEMTQHVHAMYRDPTNDYGVGLQVGR